MDRRHRRRVERLLEADIVERRPLEGGHIGTVERVDFADGKTVAVKTGDTPLSVEAQMLQYLDERGLPVPTVYDADDDLLLLEFVEGRSEITDAVERDGADHLAALHDQPPPTPAFGFPFDTLTGPITQPNPWIESWPQFYATCRLEHVLEVCRAASTIDRELAARVQRVIDSIERFIPIDTDPGLIHGDIWKTNLLTDGESVRAFLDPACYYADPEIELAYIDWTETFGDVFFERYDDRRGIAPGFFERRRFCYRLYPLLVHLHLFGSPYDVELAETLERVVA